jgi:flagellar biosynthesis/type III secretory pathway M-ring protein FliF/YscJ
VVTPFKKTQETIQDATKQLGESSTILLAVAGVAVVIATIALVVSLSRN